MDERHQLGNQIIARHNDIHEQLGNENLRVHWTFDDNVNVAHPVRVRISNVNGISRQYHIHKNKVHAEYFFDRWNVDKYGHLWRYYGENPNHLFGNGIEGNGMGNMGPTRSIKLTLNQGGNQFHPNDYAIAEQCVHQMLVLMQHLEPHLPEQYRIPIHFPQQ